jgi:hypothetical protein
VYLRVNRETFKRFLGTACTVSTVVATRMCSSGEWRKIENQVNARVQQMALQ